MSDELMQAIEAEYEAEFAAEFSDGYKPKPKPKPKRKRRPNGLSGDELVAWIYENFVEEDEHGCLMWTGVRADGHPQISLNGKTHKARRWLWTQLTGTDKGHTQCARSGVMCLNFEHNEVAGQLKRGASKSEAIEHAMTYKVDKGGPDDCWPWKGAVSPTGYPQLAADGVTQLGHRLVYEHYNGPLDNEPVHHTCANRWCVNPAHLQRVSQRENMAEMLERNYYIKRIAEQDDRIAELEARLCELETRSDFDFYRWRRLSGGR